MADFDFDRELARLQREYVYISFEWESGKHPEETPWYVVVYRLNHFNVPPPADVEDRHAAYGATMEDALRRCIEDNGL